MAKTKISEYSTTAGNNTDINSINIAEGCAPSGINDAIRELMRQLKEFQTGGAGDSVNSGGDFSVATNKFTVASATGNTAVAGTLGATGDFAVNTNKFTVAASSGNTAVAGTFAVTGATTLTGALVANGNSTLGDADTDTVTLNASFVNGTTLKTAKTATNTLALAAYDVDGTAYTNLVTLTAGNTPSLALTSTAVGTINNMSIGATTASTGAFTTLSASSDVTLSGGTANGVLYLNGSKVATSGSALTFDGTNLGVGAATPSAKLDLGGTVSSTEQIRFSMGGNVAWIGSVGSGTANGLGNLTFWTRDGSSAVVRYQIDGTGNSIWSVAGSEQMRLTSTGLGIGTSSVSSKLDVVGANKTNTNEYGTITAFSSDAYAIDKGGSIAFWGKYNSAGGSAAYGRIYGAKQDATDGSFLGYLGFSTSPGGAPVERMRLDASGNLGLGVTPSAWVSTAKGLQISSVAAFSGNSSTTNVSNNVYLGASGWQTLITGASSLYSQYSGKHEWNTASSVSAGGFPTFTTAMTLDASGNLLVGTTTASGVLTVSKSSGTSDTARFQQPSTTTGGYCIKTNAGSNAGTYYHAEFQAETTAVGSIYSSGTTTTYATSSDYRLKTVTGAVSGSGARIDLLEPVEYTWNSDGSIARGFLAHKFQEVYPSSVSGTKDAIDAEGNPIYQTMQASTSEVIADLVAEIKSLRARVAALES